MKVGPLYVARNSLQLTFGRTSIGVFGRYTLSSQPTGWAVGIKSPELNRSITMSIDRPSICRYRW